FRIAATDCGMVMAGFQLQCPACAQAITIPQSVAAIRKAGATDRASRAAGANRASSAGRVKVIGLFLMLTIFGGAWVFRDSIRSQIQHHFFSRPNIPPAVVVPPAPSSALVPSEPTPAPIIEEKQ